MSVATRPLTYDDLLDTPDDGNRYEIIGGELVVSPAPTPKHQLVLYRISRVVGDIVERDTLGQVFFAPLDVRFHPHDIVEPDLLFIRRERLHLIQSKLVEGAPDLVVEVLSPSSRTRDRVRKMALYAGSGVEEYWIADPDHKTLTVYALVNGTYQPVEAINDVVSSTVLPGLHVEISDLFREGF